MQSKKTWVGWLKWITIGGAVLAVFGSISLVIATLVAIIGSLASSSALATTTGNAQAVTQSLVAVTGMQQAVAMEVVKKANIGGEWWICVPYLIDIFFPLIDGGG